MFILYAKKPAPLSKLKRLGWIYAETSGRGFTVQLNYAPDGETLLSKRIFCKTADLAVTCADRYYGGRIVLDQRVNPELGWSIIGVQKIKDE